MICCKCGRGLEQETWQKQDSGEMQVPIGFRTAIIYTSQALSHAPQGGTKLRGYVITLYSRTCQKKANSTACCIHL